MPSARAVRRALPFTTLVVPLLAVLARGSSAAPAAPAAPGGSPLQLVDTPAGGLELRRQGSIVAPLPPPAPAKLTAVREDPAMPAGRPLGGVHFVAASTTSSAGTDARGLGAPTAQDDGDPRTVWSEGLGGDGRGEFLTARALSGPYHVRGLRIVPGDASKPAAFKARSRIKALSVAFGPAPARHF